MPFKLCGVTHQMLVLLVLPEFAPTAQRTHDPPVLAPMLFVQQQPRNAHHDVTAKVTPLAVHFTVGTLVQVVVLWGHASSTQQTATMSAL